MSNYNAEQVEEVIQEFKEVPAVNQAGAKRPPAGLRWHESRLVIIKGFLHLGRSRS